MRTSSTSTSSTVTISRKESMLEKTWTRSTIRPPGPPTATSTPGRSSAAARSRIAVHGIGELGLGGLSGESWRRDRGSCRPGETRPDPAPSAGPGARTCVTLSGASGPLSHVSSSATAAQVASLSPAGSRTTISVGVPAAGKRSRASSKARVDSASEGRKSAASFSVTSSSPGSCEIRAPATTTQTSSVIPFASRAADEVGDEAKHGLSGSDPGARRQPRGL